MLASHQREVKIQPHGKSRTDHPSESLATPAKAAVKKLSVLLPADLHRRARRHALLHDKTLTTLIIELLNQALEESEREQPPG